MTTQKLVIQAVGILSGNDWQANGDAHIQADEQLQEALNTLVESHNPDDVLELVAALDIGPVRTIISDRLELIEADLVVSDIEAASIEIGVDELDRMIDSGQAQSITAEQVRSKLGHRTH